MSTHSQKSIVLTDTEHNLNGHSKEGKLCQMKISLVQSFLSLIHFCVIQKHSGEGHVKN